MMSAILVSLPELNGSYDRPSGPWTGEEEKSLRKAIEEANLAIGAEALSPEAPWEVVSAKMGHTRTSTQCRVKW
jgi:hypothetical protein